MKKFYTTVLIFPAILFIFNCDAQNVRAIQTSTKPQAKQINNNPVIVIPKAEAAPQQNSNREKQKSNSHRTCRKVENQNNSGDNRKKQLNKPRP